MGNGWTGWLQLGGRPDRPFRCGTTWSPRVTEAGAVHSTPVRFLGPSSLTAYFSTLIFLCRSDAQRLTGERSYHPLFESDGRSPAELPSSLVRRAGHVAHVAEPIVAGYLGHERCVERAGENTCHVADCVGLTR